MWQKTVRKTVYSLDIGNYCPDLTRLTHPLMKRYAKKIGAEFHLITERQFPDWPIVYEKLQIYQLAQEHGNDWSIYIDGDALVHPDMLDLTAFVSKDTVIHNDFDVVEHRFAPDRFFLRDGRHIGSGNWFAMASDWCIELWKPLDDLTLQDAVERIHPTAKEFQSGTMEASHLIDDFTLSRNIAKYGLKAMRVKDLYKTKMGYTPEIGYLWHRYLLPEEVKVVEALKVLKEWGVHIT